MDPLMVALPPDALMELSLTVMMSFARLRMIRESRNSEKGASSRRIFVILRSASPENCGLELVPVALTFSSKFPWTFLIIGTNGWTCLRSISASFISKRNSFSGSDSGSPNHVFGCRGRLPAIVIKLAVPFFPDPLRVISWLVVLISKFKPRSGRLVRRLVLRLFALILPFNRGSMSEPDNLKSRLSVPLILGMEGVSGWMRRRSSRSFLTVRVRGESSGLIFWSSHFRGRNGKVPSNLSICPAGSFASKSTMRFLA